MIEGVILITMPMSSSSPPTGNEHLVTAWHGMIRPIACAARVCPPSCSGCRNRGAPSDRLARGPAVTLGSVGDAETEVRNCGAHGDRPARGPAVIVDP